MWIGRPGALRQITDGAKSFDRSPDLRVSEFVSLEGGVTTWAPPVRPRRLKVSWEAMQPSDFTHLDRLARRIEGPGPVAVLDPLARNLLAADQAAGIGPAGGKWAYNSAEITLYGGSSGPSVANTVSVDALPATGLAELVWRHPVFTGVPVAAGQTYTWWVPGLVASGAAMGAARVAWYDAARKWVSTSTASTTGSPLVAVAPPTAAYVYPFVAFTAKGVWPLGASVLAPGDIAASLLAGERPLGDGCPAMSITRYSEQATPGAGEFRNVSVDLVEVTG
ncbi:hypothetical protein ACIOUE_38100 [Streptomyces xanthochromogenes]|uniref:hypothetical protein n=1 Tax=Streptomyces xanthochromogenes TaxID=67384 RepID=UPI00381C09FE